MTQLKPCPFCGNKVYAELEQQTRWICCPNCEQGIEGDADCITANALVELWNSRPAEDKLLAAIANLQDWLGAWKESLDISMQTDALIKQNKEIGKQVKKVTDALSALIGKEES